MEGRAGARVDRNPVSEPDVVNDSDQEPALDGREASMSDQQHEGSAEELPADLPPTTEASDEVLSAVLDRLNALAFDLLDACLECTRQRGAYPTVEDVAHLQAEASRTLRFWADGSFGDRQERRRLTRARQMSGVDVAPVSPGAQARHERGRDLAVWFSPIAGTPHALTTTQAAYIIQMETFRRLDRIMEDVLGDFAGADPAVVESVRESIVDYREWWTRPTYERRGEQVHCEHCLVDLTHLNTAEVGDTDECIMCRGWLTSGQRREQRVARLLDRLPAPL